MKKWTILRNNAFTDYDDFYIYIGKEWNWHNLLDDNWDIVDYYSLSHFDIVDGDKKVKALNKIFRALEQQRLEYEEKKAVFDIAKNL